MSESGNVETRELEQYRSYLLLLARMHLAEGTRERVEPSDVVQQTLLEAHLQAAKLPAVAEERTAWLRTALANNIRDARKNLRRQKRDVTRERSLEDQLQASSQQLDGKLAALQSSPSRQAMRNEDLLRLADALWKLPEGQHEVIVLHHLQGWTLSQTARRLDKTDAAVAGLLHRGLRKLRELLCESCER
jgi:RNA polymerase sigma-70 factor, ECF subfamily